MRRGQKIAFVALLVVISVGEIWPAKADGYKIRYSFQSLSLTDGANPFDAPTSVDGRLYGTTSNGGAHGFGTIVRGLPGGGEEVVYSFLGGDDGFYPEAGLLKIGGLLYGTTSNGGIFGHGTAFSFAPISGIKKVLHDFQGASDGTLPNTNLVNLHGIIYGTTFGGGFYQSGTIFSLDPANGVEKTIYAFQGGNDGSYPQGGLVAVGASLYGTTTYGGSNGVGTAFALNPKTGTLSTLHSFSGTPDGAGPKSSLTELFGTLYGTTYGGGASGHGTVFSIDQVSGTLSVVYSFRGGSDGAYPTGGLASVGGTLYGTTVAGADATSCYQGCGTVFSVNPKTGTEVVLHAFLGGSDGAVPVAGLLHTGDTLFGSTAYGGSNDAGIVFAIKP